MTLSSKMNGKKAHVVFVDGQIIEGILCDYTTALDNPENKASICIGNTMFFEDEVKSIDWIK